MLGISYGELFLLLGASAALIDEAKGSDIVLEAILEAEVANNAKEFFSQPNQLKSMIFDMYMLLFQVHLKKICAIRGQKSASCQGSLMKDC
ncbi:hypothetical protein KY290_002555 [Solanum tuberosum]|uniref:Uncharacterized protein n=1 Tax=Solanum tuberosum TaxID=4113 RepID=A0ABQ7WSI4_SOLTU|nr:hypothetical protein KY285_004074 [Solanum tuberosum]KAH0782957.1 hypothetical protein KY290_002555 [Solanum tuberosum]